MAENEVLAVIIPIYNVEEFLPQCIDSVINQTYTKLEIILVNDGSKDSCAEICDRYAGEDSRIRVIHKENEGLISARYAGVQVAEAGYISFVDGDDWIEPDMYRNLMRNMTEYHADLVTSGCIRYYGRESQRIDKDIYVSMGLHDRESIVNNIIPIMIRCGESHIWGIDPSMCTKIFCRKLLMQQMEKLKDYSFYWGEDSAIVYPYILQAQSIYCTRKGFYYHRIRKRDVLPPYIADEDCIDHLYEFYSYLKKIFIQSENIRVLMKQLDLLFLDLVKIRQEKKYNIIDYFKRQDFPFDKVPKDSKVILYGAGKTGNNFYRQIKDAGEYEVVLWVDAAHGKYGSDIVSPSVIPQVRYDYVVIAVAQESDIDDIYHLLIKMSVPEEKIVYNGDCKFYD